MSAMANEVFIARKMPSKLIIGVYGLETTGQIYLSLELFHNRVSTQTARSADDKELVHFCVLHPSSPSLRWMVGWGGFYVNFP